MKKQKVLIGDHFINAGTALTSLVWLALVDSYLVAAAGVFATLFCLIPIYMGIRDPLRWRVQRYVLAGVGILGIIAIIIVSIDNLDLLISLILVVISFTLGFNICIDDYIVKIKLESQNKQTEQVITIDSEREEKL